MYRLNEIDLWREGSHELLLEAENERLARRLRAPRSERAPRSTHGSRISPLRRATALWNRTSVPFFRA
jgi:hypothetical protein